MKAKTPKRMPAIAPDALGAISTQLASNEAVRFALPASGLLNVDRQVPFLFVYRRPPGVADKGTDRLIRSEASYLIVPGERQHHRWATEVVRCVSRTLSGEFGGFLIIEIWSGPDRDAEVDADWAPGFRIVNWKGGPPTATVNRFEKHLRTIKLLKKVAEVETTTAPKVAPLGLAPLLSKGDATSIPCSLLGLEVRPIYRDPTNGDVFPLTLRSLRRQLSRTLKRAAHHFAVKWTSHTPPSYLALGRRGFVRTVLDIDRQMSLIADSFDFLLNVTPINNDIAWRQFRREHFEKEPQFVYRPLPADPIVLKRKVAAIPTERIEDPALEDLYRDKQVELDRKLTMLLDRNSWRFMHGSLQVYGKVDSELVGVAGEILDRLPRKSRDEKGGKLTVEEFATAARRELDFYRNKRGGHALTCRVEVRDDIFSGLLVSQGNLLIGRQANIPRSRVRALLEHEVGTHVVTYLNGRAQPLRILYDGLVGYDELQEGLAVLAEYLVGGLSRARLRLLAGRVVAVSSLVGGATFVDTFRRLDRDYDFSHRRAFDITMRVYRAGGLTKDIVYLRGLVKMLGYFSEGNDLEPLLVGKIGRQHIPVVRELQLRNILKAAPLRPRYLDDPAARERLAGLRQGASVFDLVKSV